MAQNLLANEDGIHKRLLDSSSRSSANASRKPALRTFARPNFLFVFEGCSEGPPPLRARRYSRNSFSLGPYSPDLLTLGDLVGCLKALFLATFLGMSPSEFVRIY